MNGAEGIWPILSSLFVGLLCGDRWHLGSSLVLSVADEICPRNHKQRSPCSLQVELRLEGEWGFTMRNPKTPSQKSILKAETLDLQKLGT